MPYQMEAMKQADWHCEETGWWTHDVFGGVCREDDGRWYAYPRDRHDAVGSFDTLRDACRHLEERHGKPSLPKLWDGRGWDGE